MQRSKKEYERIGCPFWTSEYPEEWFDKHKNCNCSDILSDPQNLDYIKKKKKEHNDREYEEWRTDLLKPTRYKEGLIIPVEYMAKKCGLSVEEYFRISKINGFDIEFHFID